MASRRKGNKWMADFMVDGVRYRQTGFNSEAESDAWELEARAALKLGKPLPEVRKKLGGVDSGSLGGLLRETERLHWDIACKPGNKSRLNARTFVDFVGAHVPAAEAFTQENIDNFIRYLQEERSVSNSTLNRYKSAVMVMAKRVPGITLPRWAHAREGRGRLRFFTEFEERLILQTLELWGFERERDFFIFLLDTGCRPWSEGATVQWKDFGPKQVIFYGADGRGTKNDESRMVPLTRRAIEAVERQRQYGLPGPFTDFRPSPMNKLWDRLQGHVPSLADAVIYTCRHTCASRLVQRGVDLRRVQVWMGHKTIQITLRYALLAPNHLIDAVSVLEQPTKVRTV